MDETEDQCGRGDIWKVYQIRSRLRMAHVQREELSGRERASCVGVRQDWAAGARQSLSF